MDDLHNYLNRKKIMGRVFEVSLGKADAVVPAKKVSDFDARLLLADVDAVSGKFEAARQEFLELSKRDPDNPALNRSQGYLALSLSDRNSARLSFEKAFAAGESDPWMCLELSRLDHESAQPPDKALAAIERAVRTKPGYTDALIQLGLLREDARQYDAALDALLSIPKITAKQATEVYWAISYAWFESGDLDKARASIATAKKYSRDPKSTAELDQLLALADARAKSATAPRPGEKTAMAVGVLKSVDCSPGRSLMVLAVGDSTMAFDIPDPKTVEFAHAGGVGLTLSCGPQKPLKLTVDYAPGLGSKEGSAGLIRRLAY
jgi:tetratricopeptide (TPR) repeat protein